MGPIHIPLSQTPKIDQPQPLPQSHHNMSMSKIKTIFQPFTAFQKSQDAREGGPFPLRLVLQMNFSVYTWMLVGASVHGLTTLFLPARPYILLISVGLLILKLTNTYLQANNIISSPYLKGAIPGRTTALLPDKKTGEFTLASTRKIAIFHLFGGNLLRRQVRQINSS